DEYVSYVIFFPALSAGPIDRIERFVPELRQPQQLDREDWIEIIKRVLFGLFKKFVIADTLAVIAIDDGLGQNADSTLWMWVFVYAYAFQIYFDFSGYTDMAIGMGRLAGIRLPENFRSPYLKPNITQFWNNWHITLTQWFRSYYFNPLTRFLRRTNLPAWVSLAIVQLSTMVLIGLWHGATWNFVFWGLWHGIGLFIHNRWQTWVNPHLKMDRRSARQQNASTMVGIVLTFHFVALGWVFFALSAPEVAKHVLSTLFGLTR
ncbi:MAG: MBOAT family protein, partial [Anaerolineae bacterium]|nr:MBOAT family protein [Anaerolineae bacterium]